MNKGIFITVEGTDGSGKSTQIGKIRNYLEERGYDVVTAREPGGTVIGEKIRDILLDGKNTNMDNITEILLYEAARAQIVREIIKPALQSGKVVICDRYADSTLAYQGYGRGFDKELINTLNGIATGGLLPDITFLFILAPEEAMGRKSKNTKPDRMELEGTEFRRKVYGGYLDTARSDPDRIKQIDGSGSVDEVFLEVKKYLDRLILLT